MKKRIPDRDSFFHKILKRLSGVEPPHMPPEGIALSTELQTHSGCSQKTSVSTALYILSYNN